VMSKRTKILLILAVIASIPFGVQLWRNTLGCKTVSVSDGGFHVVLVPDPTGESHLPCPTEDPSRLSNSIVVLTWITFGCAAVYSGTLDATDALQESRRGGTDDAWLES
jgi:hypothetical protein